MDGSSSSATIALAKWGFSAAAKALVVALSRMKGVVTHDVRMVEGFDRVYHIADGRIQN